MRAGSQKTKARRVVRIIDSHRSWQTSCSKDPSWERQKEKAQIWGWRHGENMGIQEDDDAVGNFL